MKIIICGFMGSGKTTFLERVKSNCSEENNKLFDFKDLDEEVLKEQKGKYGSISDLVKSIGWSSFRKLEFDLVHRELETEKDFFISLGGGALNARSLQKIKALNGRLIWLNTPFEHCYRRVMDNPESRPLSTTGEEGLRELYNTRLEYYSKADLILDERQQDELADLDLLLKKL